ncbi:MAG: tetratricopeptide repeat protein, partial [Bacteroidota bacterium]
LMSINGYVYQLPLTWYAQKKKWDLPPGFENGKNMRFSREIGLECMSCHNAMPTFENNSQNLFTQIPNGIDCERCHGPGALHVKEKTAGNWVDTATQIDYTIVNPKKLSWELQTDICQRCHLQGNAVLKEGKSFTDFRPGMKLSDFIEVYMPKYKDRDDEFIMASHAQRLQMSKCYIQSANGQASAQNKLTCISCHNPHVSVKVTGKQVFNQACAQCHDIKTACKETTIKRNSASDNCVGCHMPLSGTIDIPHVTVHDHYIRKSAPQKVKSAVKDFAGIYCVNNPRSASDAKAKAYLAYAEKFEGERISVDSGVWYTNQAGTSAPAVFDMRVHYLSLAKKESEMMQLASAVKPSSVNEPWTCYRIGQAYQNNNEWIRAEFWYRRALTLAPQNLSFMNKLGEVLIQQQKLEEGMEVLNQSLRKNHKQADALTNLGFACVTSGDIQKGLRCYDEALALSPDNEQALLNKAAVLNAKGQKAEARKLLQCIIVLNPGNTAVKQLLKNL